MVDSIILEKYCIDVSGLFMERENSADRRPTKWHVETRVASSRLKTTVLISSFTI